MNEKKRKDMTGVLVIRASLHAFSGSIDVPQS